MVRFLIFYDVKKRTREVLGVAKRLNGALLRWFFFDT